MVKEKNEQADPLCKVERRLLLPVKNNLAPDAGTGMAFFIQDGAVFWEPTPIQTTAQDYFAEQEPGRRGPEPTAQRAALEWLENELSAGPVCSDDLRDRAKEDGHSWRTIQRAKAESRGRIVAEKIQHENKLHWQWRLNGQIGERGDF